MSRNGLVKITLDGLLLLSFRSCANGTRCQAGVLVTKFDEGEEHELKIEVKGPGVSGYFTYSHQQVSCKAPLWLYVGTKNGAVPTDHTAEPYKMKDPCDPNAPSDESFSYVLGMEKFHGVTYIKIKSGMAPILNIPQGVFRSANLKTAQYRESGSSAWHQYECSVATETYAEIDLDDYRIAKPYLTLCSEKKGDLFPRIPLEAGQLYEVTVKNEPIEKGPDHHQSNHFRYYYQAFEEPPMKKYEVDVYRTDDAPPCISGRLKDGSLPG